MQMHHREVGHGGVTDPVTLTARVEGGAGSFLTSVTVWWYLISRSGIIFVIRPRDRFHPSASVP